MSAYHEETEIGTHFIYEIDVHVLILSNLVGACHELTKIQFTNFCIA
jgi:hypothetical protein